MKKVLSFLLVLMLSLTVFGVSKEASAEAADASIFLHIYQHDGVYTNTGVGVWNGGLDDWYTQKNTTTDDFGAVVQIDFTTADLAASNLNDEIEFKPGKDATDGGTLGGSLLAPGEGKVMLDITDLKDGTKTELHAYYVEGAKDFFIKENDLNGVALFIYADPRIASEPDTYDGWGFHTWNNGDGGTSRPDYFDFPELDIDVVLPAGAFGDVEMRLGGVEVDSTSQNTIGFIMHYGATGDVEEKACPTWSDMFINVEDIKPADVSTMGGASMQYYIHGTCDWQTDYASFSTNFEQAYRDSLKNKFVEPTSIINPTTVDVTFFSKKEAWQLLPSLFTVKDSEGTAIDIKDIVIPGAIEVGQYDSVVEQRAQTIVVLYVKSDVPANELGIVGSFTGWDISNPTMPVTTDSRGYYVYELATFGSGGEFTVIDKGHDPNDPSAAAWSWDDKISGNDNIVVDTSDGGTLHMFMDTADFALVTDHQVGVAADLTNYTYTADTTCANNLVTIMLDTARPAAELGLVGSINGWNVGGSLAPTGTTTEGVVYWEVCTTDTSGEFKIKHDKDNDGFTWDSGTDPEVTPNNVAFTVTDGVANIAVLDLNHTATLQPEYIYELTIYFLGLDDASKAGIIGSWQDPAFDGENPIIPTIQDGFGNWIIETEFYGKNDSFKVLYDNNGDGLNALDATTLNAYEIGLDTELNKIYVFDINDYSLTTIGTTIEDEDTTFTHFQIIIDDEFTYDAEYSIEFIETPAELCTQDDVDAGTLDAAGNACVLDAVKVAADVLTWDLGFTTVVNFVETDVVEEMGTYAVSPTEIMVQFTTMQDLFAINDVLALYDASNTMVAVAETGYTLDLGTNEYTATLSCDAPGNLVFVHFNATTEIENLAHMGMVGSIQATDWNPESAITPTGMDADGNYVFEVCLPETDTNVEFKILFDEEGTFNWGDTELVTSNIALAVADGPHYYLEEGLTALNTSTTHTINLSAALDKTSSYYIVLKDASGFDIKVPVLMDTEAPTVNATIKTSVSFTIENNITFNINDYFTVLNFVDNRDGEIPFTVKTALDFSTLGTQTMTIAATDMWGNEATYDIIFTIQDTTKPELVIDEAKEYEAGSEAPDWATFATSSDGTVTVDASDVNMDVADVYYVNYTAEDAAGNKTLGTLQVTIVAGEPETGCFGSFSFGSSIGLIVAAVAGGTVLFFVRKKQ